MRLKRAYEPAAADDGTRVLVERLWPRGVSKAEAALDDWMREHRAEPGAAEVVRPRRRRAGTEFRRRYRGGACRPRRQAVEALRVMARTGPLTLVFAAHDTEH